MRRCEEGRQGKNARGSPNTCSARGQNHRPPHFHHVGTYGESERTSRVGSDRSGGCDWSGRSGPSIGRIGTLWSAGARRAPGLWREAQLWARSKALNAKVDPEHEATWRREAPQGNLTNLVPYLREFGWGGAVGDWEGRATGVSDLERKTRTFFVPMLRSAFSCVRSQVPPWQPLNHIHAEVLEAARARLTEP